MKIRTNDLCYMAILLALLVVCSKISINIGPIPITLQTFSVIILGYILKLKKSLIVFLTYIIIGLIGIPVFSGGGGFDYILKPSFGFIIGFMLSSFITGIEFKKSNKYILFLQGLLGLVIIDVIGLIYMYLIMNYYYGMDKDMFYIIEVGLTPFIIKDIISVVISTIVYLRVKNLKVMESKPIY